MGLTIKSAKTCQMVRELAKLTGESPTVAVRRAIRERLERVRGKRGLAEQLLRIGQECADRLTEPYKSMSIDQLLYDEKGLPK